ncbi:MAG: hypothetical protein K0S65_1923 [Labilithrix sp.]|nr:hypothetical protein [Labilithrix sp.]
MNDATGQEEQPRMCRAHAEHEEHHHQNLKRETGEKRPPSSKPIRHHAHDRIDDDTRGAVGRKDEADEREWKANTHPHAGENRKRDPTGNACEHHARRQRQREPTHRASIVRHLRARSQLCAIGAHCLATLPQRMARPSTWSASSSELAIRSLAGPCY